jgi:PKD repeat protein
MRLGGTEFRGGSRAGGPEIRNELRVVRTVETQIRQDTRRRGLDTRRAILAAIVAAAVVAGGLFIDMGMRQAPNKRPGSSLVPGRVRAFTGDPVVFAGSGSRDPDGSVESYVWHFTPGGLCETSRSSIVRSFDRPGLYNVSLRVRDARDEYSGLCQTQVAVVPLPSASTNASLSLDPVAFWADNSSLGDAPVTFSWNFSDGTPGASGPSVSHAFPRAGNYTVRFEASYRNETVSCFLRVNVTNRPPVAFYNITEPGPYYTNHLWMFDANQSFDPDGAVVAWSWSFGDGTSDEINGSLVGHRFSRAGVFNVTLRVQDRDGAGASMIRSIVVGKDMYIVMVMAEMYVDQKGTPRANLSVTFDNPGDPKPPGAVRLSVSAHTAAQSDIADPESHAVEYYGAEAPHGATGLTIRVSGLLLSPYLPQKTWFYIELGYMSSVVDARWYQQS